MKKEDTRVNDAILIRELSTQSGFKVLKREWEKVKEQAHKDVFDESLPESNLSQRQKIYNQITEWIALPDFIMKRGEIAVEEQKAEKDRKDHPIKSNIPFMKNRY